MCSWLSSTEGNLVHSLDDQNPSRLILNAVQKSTNVSTSEVDVGIKDDEYFLAVLRDEKVCLRDTMH